MSLVNCPECGIEISDKAQSCPHCGMPFSIQRNQNNVYYQNQVLNTANVQTGKPVNKAVYCLLAFFLGGLGIHKFYVGKIGMGILYVLFCWTYIPLILSIIELIIALSKKSDGNGNIWF